MRSPAGSAGANGMRARRLLGALALAFSTAGCISDGQPMLVSGRSATVAFESIDGPPQPVFQKLVENLASEAVTRQVSVISREANPSYRVRGYMAAHVEKRRIHIGWVWDVYDANRRRVLRIADEELGAAGASDAWGAADEAMLRRIARSGMDRIAMFLGGGGAAPPASPPAGGDGVAVAAADEGSAVEGEPPRQAASAMAPARPRPGQSQQSALAAALALADTRR